MPGLPPKKKNPSVEEEDEPVELTPPPNETEPSVPEDKNGWKYTPLSGVGNRPPLVIYGGKTTTTYNKTIL